MCCARVCCCVCAVCVCRVCVCGGGGWRVRHFGGLRFIWTTAHHSSLKNTTTTQQPQHKQQYWLHPTRFRTELCQFGAACRRSVCFFGEREGDAHHTATPTAAQKRATAATVGSRGPLLAASPLLHTLPTTHTHVRANTHECSALARGAAAARPVAAAGRALLAHRRVAQVWAQGRRRRWRRRRPTPRGRHWKCRRRQRR